ncbi:MAG: DUF2179 domain-containing protein [Candidatus Omnitrophota bacterium]|jgi:uncharacterized protein YebE (UPF0316 family)|nr:MAG: DUF2179 domain-containing protein [Candidatus Omnitrophota bacterium]
MDFSDWISPNLLHWLLPVLIFCARILDVSVGTLRIVFITRGMKLVAPVLGFIEVLIWVVVVSQVIKSVNSPLNYLAYASGYATGNYVGMYIESKLALGMIIIRIITRKDASNLINYLKANNYGVTNVPAIGNEGHVNLVFTIIKRKKLPEIIEKVNEFNPRAFYSVEDVRAVGEGIFPPEPVQLGHLNVFRPLMKGK